MRTVLRNTSEVCHVWASQSQSEGRAGNVSFDGPTIYSYGWWPMASFIEPDVVLYRDESYSVTTSCHQSAVHSAVSHCTIFRVIALDGNHQKNIDHYCYKMRCAADKFWASQAMEAKWNKGEYARTCAEAKDYAKHFGCEALLPPLFGLELSGKKAAEVLERAEARQAVIDENRRTYWEQQNAKWAKQREKERAAKALFDIQHGGLRDQWRNGGPRSIEIDGFRFSVSFASPALRYLPDTDEIETSMGAYVPAKQAETLYRMLKSGHSVRGHQIGGYTVISYNGCLKIGCHQIQDAEIERLADSMKWSK